MFFAIRADDLLLVNSEFIGGCGRVARELAEAWPSSEFIECIASFVFLVMQSAFSGSRGALVKGLRRAGLLCTALHCSALHCSALRCAALRTSAQGCAGAALLLSLSSYTFC